MNEESDGINENEINNSEVVILPERSHVEELLLSDQSQIREEQNAYERKLDEKLKDLGLYEDDMTIIQKEELLAVVVISCETAEQEENKRQLIREYLEGAQSLEEEIEFSFQESAWLAGEANLLCSSTVTRSKDEDSSPSSSKVYTSFLDGESSTSRKTSNVFDSADCNETSAPPNSPDIYDDEAVYAEISADPQSSTSENHPKKSGFNRSRPRSVAKECLSPDTNLKIDLSPRMLQEHDSKEVEPSEILDRQDQKELLDRSMAVWKPCMSPKDKPLSNFRLNKEDENDVSLSSLREKFNKYLNCFDKTASLKSKALKSKRCPVPKVTLISKPYVIMHHGNIAKKTSKLDDYDYTVGVSDKGQNNEEEEEKKFMPCNTVTRAKSAFHRVKPLSHGRLVSVSDQNAQGDGPSTKTTRSGATYGSKRLKSEVGKPDASAQVDGLCDQTQAESRESEKYTNLDRDSLEDTAKRLPKFSAVKPDISACKMVVPSFVSPGDKSQTNATVKFNCDSGILERRLKRGEKAGNKSEKDYSSDSSSSLIDVETVVDDEVDEFVLKRKVPPISQKSNYLKSTTQSKRFKKSDL